MSGCPRRLDLGCRQRLPCARPRHQLPPRLLPPPLSRLFLSPRLSLPPLRQHAAAFPNVLSAVFARQTAWQHPPPFFASRPPTRASRLPHQRRPRSALNARGLPRERAWHILRSSACKDS